MAFVLQVYCAFAFVSSAEARTVRYFPIRGIDFNVGLSYGKVSGDHREGETFRQEYGFSLNGFAVDPRLLSYDFDLGFSSESNDGYYGKDKWLTRTGLKLSFFNGINRERGLKLWRYVPSPLVLRYEYSITDNYYFTTYGLSMHYNRSGYIRFFSRGKLIYYDDGRGGTTSTNNRYKLKYQDNTYNYNRYGDGNWNRNGNGNWNRNGNGNWNRNGNGNWNRNGNGNFNGGSNNNTGNWDSGNDEFIRNLQKEPSIPLGFSFPHLNLDITRGEWESKEDNGFKYDYTMGNIRIDTANSLKARFKEGKYSSRYSLWHRFYDSSSDVAWDVSAFEAHNTWEHFRLWNIIEKTRSLEDEKLEYELDSNYANRYKAVTYNFNLGGLYTETDTYTSYEYGASLSVITGLTSRARLTPNLVSTTSLGLTLGRERDRVVDGVRYSGRALYYVSLDERLEYFGFRRFHILADLNTGVSESGTPINFLLRGTTREFRRLSLVTSYRYNTEYLKAYDESSSYQKIDAALNYRISSSLSTRHGVGYTDQIESYGVEADDSSLSYTGSIAWRISSRSSADLEYRYNEYSIIRAYGYLANFRMQSSLRGHLTVAMQRNWDNIDEGTDDRLLAAYNWSYRQFVTSIEYDYHNAKSEATASELWIKLRRNFSLRTRRL